LKNPLEEPKSILEFCKICRLVEWAIYSRAKFKIWKTRDYWSLANHSR